METVYGRCKAMRDRLHSRTVVQDLSEAPDAEYATEFDGSYYWCTYIQALPRNVNNALSVV